MNFNVEEQPRGQPQGAGIAVGSEPGTLTDNDFGRELAGGLDANCEAEAAAIYRADWARHGRTQRLSCANRECRAS